MLNKAKLRKSVVTEVKQVKRQKKHTEPKPLITVGKTNGKYHIEMQVSENDEHTPLIYDIESVNNKAKLRKREKLQKYLTSNAVKNVWTDPFHPQNCENICLKSFYEAMGITAPETVPENIEENSCTCEDEEVSSSCDSSEVDWVIHFTPPISNYLRSQLSNVEEINLNQQMK
ncbi:unnamed protein product [Pieris macdunnoughi]|uniref:Uncharacterized protein n=1 Tax=Pieris macdunnoughi TaxID=345717 RepID=A0A821YH17_9NEOP|nr:unnamed protein product [Pieris macdunnoughi]